MDKTQKRMEALESWKSKILEEMDLQQNSLRWLKQQQINCEGRISIFEQVRGEELGQLHLLIGSLEKKKEKHQSLAHRVEKEIHSLHEALKAIEYKLEEMRME